jgi:glutamate synthase domain-containing protein 3
LIDVPDIRDYQKINAEIIARLDRGSRAIRLLGVEGQRLLLEGLSGRWSAVVEIQGRAGPELAAGLNAPGLTVLCRGAAADGAGRSLQEGRLLIHGDAGAGLAYGQQGGVVVVAGDAGERAGLNQTGGTIVVLGNVGALGAERQAGGTFLAFADRIGPMAGRGHRGGRLVLLPQFGEGALSKESAASPERAELATILAPLSSWLEPVHLKHPWLSHLP